ncbi:hypothetical protein LTR56_016811 [Elasticomyces elasticus]|nr:hypothetical protein LTR56_016811 [Elasticomyces elasticus]
MPGLVNARADPLCHIVTPVGMLGYGVNMTESEAAVAACSLSGVPTALILDSGSTDSGPSKLALGGMTMPRDAYVRDLRKMMVIASRYNVPLVFSSAGGSGTNDSTYELAKIVREIANEGLPRHEKVRISADLKVVVLLSDIDKQLVRERLASGDITGCGRFVPPLKLEDIDACPVIACQMGPKPFIQIFNDHPDLGVLVGGRAYDPAPYVAFAEYCYRNKNKGGFCVDEAVRTGGFTHMGKIMECGGLCATPKSFGARATVYTDASFDVEPLKSASVCTPLSVAAHTLYENTRSDLLAGPGGALDLTQATYEQCDDKRSVRVRGSRFLSGLSKGQPYQVKLEGAKAVGFRAMYIGVHRDPAVTALLIGQMDSFQQRILIHVKEQLRDAEGDWQLNWHLFGRSQEGPNEACIVGEALASTQQLANSVVANAKIANIHGAYPGQKATSGNMGHGIGGISTIPLGPGAEFCVYHLMNLHPGEEGLHGASPLFRTVVEVVPALKVNGNGRSELKPEYTGNGHIVARQEAPLVAPLAALPDAPTMGHIAKVVRSKNAGPYEITMDIMFEQAEVFHAVKEADFLQDTKVAALLGIRPDQIVWAGFFEQALAYKVTIPRLRYGKPVAAGGFMEDDVHGSQMYRPLLDMSLPDSLVVRLRELVTMSNC